MAASRIPKLCRHKSRSQGYVTLCGREHYLGHWPAGRRGAPPTVQAAYDALISSWLANGKRVPDSPAGVTVDEVILAYLTWAETRYPRRGRENTQNRLIRAAVRFVRRPYGPTPAVEFGPKKFRAVREAMAAGGWCRSVVNAQADRVRRMFKWAAAEEMVPGEVYQALRAVEGLRRGTPGVRETEPVRPVPTSVVEATLPHMPAAVRAMVRVQLLTGMRPGEVCGMTVADVDTSGPVWAYVPASHKTAHHGHARRVLIGPRGQEVLRPWLDAAGGGSVFSPAAAEAARNRERRAGRASKMTPSQAARRPKADPKRAKRASYDVTSYRNAVYRACDRAFPPPAPLAKRPDETAGQWAARLTGQERGELAGWRSRHRWHPHQLRHTAATAIRREYGVETARAVLGHTRVATTELYAEVDVGKAAEAMTRLG